MENQLIAVVQDKIHFVRGHKVMLSTDLAALYGVELKSLTQAVQRNIERFPEDFMFQLTTMEYGQLRALHLSAGRAHGTHSKYLPYAFTEQGVAMLSSVLKSERAIEVNIEIMRAFVRMKRVIDEHKDLAAKLAVLEKKYDSQFKAVFDAIRQLMQPGPVSPARRKIGFRKD